MEKSNHIQTMSMAQYVSQVAVSSTLQQALKDKAPQFIASVTSLVNSNEKLKAADKGSIIRACLTAASLDLPINQSLGFAYIIPYKDQAQFQLGYKGFIQLAQRSGQFKTINVTDVKDGEIVSEDRLTGEIKFDWITASGRDTFKTIGYVAFFELINGFEKMLYMTTDQLKNHGVKFSQSFKSGYGLWKDEFDTMAKKTVIKLLLSKYAPMTVDMQTATLSDQAIIQDDGYEYADNQPVDHEVVSTEKEKARVIAHIADAKTIKELEECQDAVTNDTEDLYKTKLDQLLEKESRKK